MKKLLLIAIAAVIGVAANAQILSSRTVIKEKKSTLWFVKVGPTINNVTHGQGAAVGVDGIVGFQRSISTGGLYWGMDLGAGTVGAKGNSSFAARFTPFTLGYKAAITKDIKLDTHLGGYAAYIADGDQIDGGMQIGAGVWYNRFNFDITYQRGFALDYYNVSNVMFRFGVSF